VSAILDSSAHLLEAEQDRWPAAYPQWEAGGKEDGAAGSPRSDGNPED
jgi:hypothetical protein